jgi:hypothetical protein
MVEEGEREKGKGERGRKINRSDLNNSLFLSLFPLTPHA